MKIFYIANIRMPTEKAHGIQIMEVCSAFTKQGVEVELVVPRRFNPIKENPFVYYDIERSFDIKRLPCIDLVRFGKFGFLVQLFSFSISTFFYSLFQKNCIFYTRDEVVALTIGFLRKRIIWEAHMGQTNFIVNVVIRLGTPMVVLAKSLRDLYLSKGVDARKIIVAPDAADISRFDITISKDEARRKLGLTNHKKIVLYKGALFARKGPGVLAEAASFLKKDVSIIFIGGTEKDIEDFKKSFGHIENISILGHRPRTETPIYQKASDVLVIPNSAKVNTSKLYTSPMKLFGYMASGIPIVASDVPSLREILNRESAFFVESDNAKALARGIEKVLSDDILSQKIAKQALLDVQSYTWDKRAKKVLDFISEVEK